LSVVLVVPDAGPLISLAKADCLDLLLLPGVPVWIVDQVRFEASGSDRFPDAIRIDRFIRSHDARIMEFTTAVGLAAAQRRAQGEVRQPGQGEAAIAEFLQRLDEVTGDPDAPVLMLFEDSDIRRSRFFLPDNVHLPSTLAFLRGLERKCLIPSAEQVWSLIAAAGRTPSLADVDLPGATLGNVTSW